MLQQHYNNVASHTSFIMKGVLEPWAYLKTNLIKRYLFGMFFPILN